MIKFRMTEVSLHLPSKGLENPGIEVTTNVLDDLHGIGASIERRRYDGISPIDGKQISPPFSTYSLMISLIVVGLMIEVDL